VTSHGARPRRAARQRAKVRDCRLSVVIPTRNEKDNVGLLRDALERVLIGIDYEVVVVDDSTDGVTRSALDALAARDPRWHVIVRPTTEQTGLSTAVVTGIAVARGAAICVMDGDLQHPAEVIPALVAAVESGADIAVASRYAAGGSRRGLATSMRRWASRLATTLTHAVFPETRRTSDPMSGFFCCRREAISGLELRPVGFKVLVELLVCAPDHVVTEVPFEFGTRIHGDSKADPKQAFLYLEHLASLFIYVPGSARPLKFLLVTVAGLAAICAPLGLLLWSGAAPLAAWIVAAIFGIAAQVGLHRAFTFRELLFRGRIAKAGRFHPSSVVSLIAGLAALALVLAPARYAPLAIAAFAWCVGMFVAIALNHPHLRTYGRRRVDLKTAGRLSALQELLGAERAYWVSPSDVGAKGSGGSSLVTADLIRHAALRGLPVLLAESPSVTRQQRLNLERESALLIPGSNGSHRLPPVAVLIRRTRIPFSSTDLDLAVVFLSEPAGSNGRDDMWRGERVSAYSLLRGVAAGALAWIRAKVSTAWRFAVVGAAGLGVNQALLWLLADGLHIHYLVGAAMASQGSTAFNFVWLEAWVFGQRANSRGRWLRFIAFDLINSSSLAIRLPVMFFLTSGLHIHYLISNVVALVLTTVLRFLISDSLIWKRHSAVRSKSAPRAAKWGAVPGATFKYRVDGLITIQSEAPLPELAFFATDESFDADVVVEIDQVGGLALRRTATVTRDGRVILYRQHLGSLFANFQISLGHPVRVLASPGLALSPHVLYTNVIEPLLRFLLIKRGHVLLHAACISVSGAGVLISAKTDTGKTSTILRILSRNHGDFYSDDMTIVNPSGVASRYPKPLTISAHTLGAVPANRLRMDQRLALALQSRVHSRGGRRFAHFLGTLNIPIMAINAGVQLAIPPPKYAIDDLVDVEIGEQISPTYLFLIERGAGSAVTELTTEEAVSELLKNSDDAYGFPPYDELAPLIELDGEGYAQLLAREREILTAALESVTCVRLCSDNFDWHQRIESYVLSTRELGEVIA
jgi:putative flippase GtrA